MSRPREKRETGEQDLFRARLDQIINMRHELVRLAQAIDWPVLEARFGAVYSDGLGMPPLPTRLMAGLAILKHTFDLSDEDLCARWVENPYFQYLCGEDFFRHDLPACFGKSRTPISLSPGQSVLGCAVLAVWPLTMTLRGAMPRRKQTRQTTVKDIRAILRLTHEQGLSVREVSERLKISKTTVSTYLLRAREAGLSGWPLPP